MYHLDDKDVDRISRNAADNYKAPGEPSWDALRQTLDKEMPQEKEKRRRGFFLFFLLVGLLVAGSLFWFHYQKNILAGIPGLHTETNTPVASDNHTHNSAEPAAKAPGNPTAVIQKEIIDPVSVKTNTGKNEQHALPVHTENKDVDASDHVNTPDKHSLIKLLNPNSKGKTLSNNTLASDSGTTNSYVRGNKNKRNKTRIAANNSSDTPATPKKTAIGKDLKDKNEAIVITNTDPVTTGEPVNDDSSKTDTEKKPASKDTANSATLPEPEKKETVKKDQKKPVSKVEKAFNIGITTGIDYTTVHFRYADNAGFNLGVMAGYQFSKKWSVYSGAIYTRKNYKLSGKDYYPPNSYWTRYVDLQTVEGYCNMWEVPLLARYTFNSKSNTRFFVSTGLSSYFMKKQQYHYNYKTVPAGTPGSSSWTNNTVYNHLFSILHFSAGFEKQIGKHLNWQVEPYAKLPLHGLGFGLIKMSSFGINFSIQYRQPLKR